jgi:hypothetical protein
VSRQSKANRPRNPRCPKCGESVKRLHPAVALQTSLCGVCHGAYGRAMRAALAPTADALREALDGTAPNVGRRVMDFLRKIRTVAVAL